MKEGPLLRQIARVVRPRVESGVPPLLNRRRHLHLCHSCSRRISLDKHHFEFSAGRLYAKIATESISNHKDSSGPLETFDLEVSRGKLRKDDFQRGIVTQLQELHDELQHYDPPKVKLTDPEGLKSQGNAFSRILHLNRGGWKSKVEEMPDISGPMGMYLYGDVGCGKTMVMDLFYETLPSHIQQKRRVHFHAFMSEVHKRAHQLKVEHGQSLDTIPLIAADIASSASVLCFDEFQVTDIADAIILRRLLQELIKHGIIIVTTSNRHPTELYKNGIQREHFVPCIDLIMKRLIVVSLDSPTDYRRISRPMEYVFFSPNDETATSNANHWFKYFSKEENAKPAKAVHTLWGRELVVPKACGKAAWFDFDSLCGQPLGASDYLEICRLYRAIIVVDIPRLDRKDLARRFITFVDAVYDSRAKLVCTSEVTQQDLFSAREDDSTAANDTDNMDSSMRHLMDDLGLDMSKLTASSIFTGEEERFASVRAISRLFQMGSKDWVEAPIDS